MNKIANVLLHKVLDNELPSELSDYYCNELLQKSKRFPRVHIIIESDLKKIKQQYVDICKVIVDRTPKNMLVVTLFAANEQLMYTYKTLDSNIPIMHAIWFSELLNSIEDDSKFKLNVICCILTFRFILYLFN